MQPLILAIFLLACLSIAGALHVYWLRSPMSQRFDRPVDGGAMLRDRRIFGNNKQWRGFVMMPPAAALAFSLFGGMRPIYPDPVEQALWHLGPGEYALLGFISGMAFMLAELPNSFLKRQFDVAPGALPSQPWLRPVCLILDRIDSTLGVLLAISVMLPLPAATWAWAVLLGPSTHALFSHWLHRAGVKPRSL
jgi:hypothetical protein